MSLTPENKDHIDKLSYQDLLQEWRYAPIGNQWFQGETGAYWKERMAKLRSENPGGAVQASKAIGWERP